MELFSSINLTLALFLVAGLLIRELFALKSGYFSEPNKFECALTLLFLVTLFSMFIQLIVGLWS
jgi:hypothetical protein